MKKFTLLAVAALVAATSTFAQTGRQQSLNQRHQRVSLTPQQAQRALSQPSRTQQRMNAITATASQQTAALARAPRLIPSDAIRTTETPEGVVHDNLAASFQSVYYSWWYGWQNGSSDNSPATIVEGADGNLYIKGLTPQLFDDWYYWVKAEPTDQPGRYVIHKQIAGYYASYDEEDNISRVVYDYDADAFVEDTETDFYVNYADGVLSTDPVEVDSYGLPTWGYGVVYEYGGESYTETSAGIYWNLSISEFNEQITELPEGAEVETLVLQHQEGGKEVQVAFVGNQVYVQSYPSAPGWYVGTVSGDKVTFKNGQFLGYDTNYSSYVWLITGHTYEAYDEDYEEYYTAADVVDEVVFDYDAASKTLTAAADDALFINGAKDRVYYAERYIGPKIYVFTEVAAVPADPEITNFWDYDEDYESSEVDFTIRTFDVDGNFILASKLSYSVYVDNELFEFDPDEYEELPQAITEIPYGTQPDSYINPTWVAFYFQPAENVGLQTIYRGLGVELRSNIVYIDVNTRDTYTVPYQNPVTAIKGVNTQQVGAVVYHDVAGRTVQAGAKGFVLKTVTLADGTQKTLKVVRK